MARRIPAHQRPKLGDWDGPIFGELGVLEVVDDQLRCHICGRLFRYLSAHIMGKHGVHPDEYRALFGLRASKSLMSPGLRETFRQSHIEMLSQHWDGAGLRTLTAEQRSANARSRRWSLQERRDEHNLEVRERNMALAQEGVGRARAAGRQWWRDAREIGALGRERFKELVADPEWKAEWAGKIKASKGGRTPITCIVCGTSFVSLTGRRTCSSACDSESRRRREPIAKRPDVRAKISAARMALGRRDEAALRALPAAAFERLPELDRLATVGFYGLSGEPPQTHRQLAVQLGVSSTTVRQHILRAVAQLIGGGAGLTSGV
jgi:hypothetical protein